MHTSGDCPVVKREVQLLSDFDVAECTFKEKVPIKIFNI